MMIAIGLTVTSAAGDPGLIKVTQTCADSGAQPGGSLSCNDLSSRCTSAASQVPGAMNPQVTSCNSGSSVTTQSKCSLEAAAGQCPNSIDLNGICIGTFSCQVLRAASAVAGVAPSFFILMVGLLSAVLLF